MLRPGDLRLAAWSTWDVRFCCSYWSIEYSKRPWWNSENRWKLLMAIDGFWDAVATHGIDQNWPSGPATIWQGISHPIQNVMRPSGNLPAMKKVTISKGKILDLKKNINHLTQWAIAAIIAAIYWLSDYYFLRVNCHQLTFFDTKNLAGSKTWFTLITLRLNLLDRF